LGNPADKQIQLRVFQILMILAIAGLVFATPKAGWLNTMGANNTLERKIVPGTPVNFQKGPNLGPVSQRR
jgi:hypothetical protein